MPNRGHLQCFFQVVRQLEQGYQHHKNEELMSIVRIYLIVILFLFKILSVAAQRLHGK
jgi:hypothetical protein